MVSYKELSNEDLRKKIRTKELLLGGNSRLKIYGKLSCKSGKRMKNEHRVFFSSEKEAIEIGYRPCGHCMRDAYKKWKRMLRCKL